MKTVWLVNPYGPIEGENWREYSFNQFGKFLSEYGCDVIWWTSSFSHHFKAQRSEGWKDIHVNEHFIIRLVPSPAYKKNFSVGRLWKDVVFSRNAYAKFKASEKPNIIIANENPMSKGKPAFKFAEKYSIPIVYDQMDIWPEFFVSVLKAPLSSMVNFVLKPVYKRRRYIYEHLSGSVALGKHYLEFMQEISPALKDKPHELIYNGIDVQQFRLQLNEPIEHPKLSTVKKDGKIWCIFAGTLGPSYDIVNIVKCAQRFAENPENRFVFIIAGSGPLEAEVINAEKRLSNFIYLGKLLPEQLIPIYGKCDIGLQAYSAGSNVDMPDKFYDYTAAGLAVVNSLTGEVSEHITNEQIGYTYAAGDTDALYTAISSLESEEKLTKCKEGAYAIGSRFDKEIQNQKLLKIIEELT